VEVGKGVDVSEGNLLGVVSWKILFAYLNGIQGW
jgi:hypothetical protein